MKSYNTALIICAALLTACSPQNDNSDNEPSAKLNHPPEQDVKSEPAETKSLNIHSPNSATHTGEHIFFIEGTPYRGTDFSIINDLNISPNPFSKCDYPNEGAELTIEYDARPSGVIHSQVWFQDRNGRQRLWSQLPGRMLPTKTGKWAHNNQKILLIDFDTKQIVAARTIKAQECKEHVIQT